MVVAEVECGAVGELHAYEPLGLDLPAQWNGHEPPGGVDRSFPPRDQCWDLALRSTHTSQHAAASRLEDFTLHHEAEGVGCSAAANIRRGRR
jgi:hypothetical protein